MARRTTISQTPAITISTQITFEEAKKSFENNCKIRNLSPQTITTYGLAIDLIVKHLHFTHINQFTVEAFELLIQILMDAGVKPVSINSKMNSWRAFFNFCANRYDFKNFEMKHLKTTEEIKECYTDSELKLLLETPATSNWVEWRNWAMINYLIATGNRLSTMLALKIKDIDFDNETIFLSTVKNRHQQLIPLGTKLSEVLKVYLSTFEWCEDDYLFQNNEGGQLQKHGAQCGIAKYNKARGVSKTSIHLFRHTFAKNFVLNGGSAFQLQALLGHSSLDMTNHYCKIYGTDLRRNFDKFNPLENLI